MAEVNVNTSIEAQTRAKAGAKSLSSSLDGAAGVGKSSGSALQGSRRENTPTRRPLTKSDAGPQTRRPKTPVAPTPVQLPRVASIPAGRRSSGEGDAQVERRPSSAAGERRMSGEGSAESDFKLDLRAQDLKALRPALIGVSKRIEFVYLRHNRLQSLEGIEVLKNLKILDASFNELSDSCLPQLQQLQSLQQLFLAGNQLQSLTSLPQLPNLEFLSVSGNAITSLAMHSLPRLEVLAASNNRITSLRDLPHLPAIEALRLDGNEFASRPHARAIAIILAGPTLRKLDGEAVTEEEHRRALELPPHTIPCLRAGWDVAEEHDSAELGTEGASSNLRPEHVQESTAAFLTSQHSQHAPPHCHVTKFVIDQPKEGELCHCDFAFASESETEEDLVLKYRWYRGPRHGFAFRSIADVTSTVYEPQAVDVGLCLKVECTPVFQGTEYPPVFVISREVVAGGRVPKIQSIRVSGEAMEMGRLVGSVSVAWCGAKPGRSRVSWRRTSPSGETTVIEGADQTEYEVTSSDVGSKLQFHYQPLSEAGAVGEAQCAETEVVQAVPPAVGDVEIVGKPVVNRTLKGKGTYVGGKEGPSRYEWLREREGTSELELATEPNDGLEYVLIQADLGARIHFKYIPVNIAGTAGEARTATTGPVMQAPPHVKKLSIVGDVMETRAVRLEATYVHADESLTTVQWFGAKEARVPSTEVEEAGMGWTSFSEGTTEKSFVVPPEAVGRFLVAKVTPRRPDEAGSSTYACTNDAVEMLPPVVRAVTVSGTVKEGEKLTASYKYDGGHEGASEFAWYSHKDGSDSGTLIPGSQGALEYTVRPEDVGRHVSFQCTPIRRDGGRGEMQRHFNAEKVEGGLPSVSNLRIEGSTTEGAELRVEKDYVGGMEGASGYRWHLLTSDGQQGEIEGVTGPVYTVRTSDVGAMINVECTPVRSDGVEGETLFSPLRGPILACPPQCEKLVFRGEAVEGEILSFEATYRGGAMGTSVAEWTRVEQDGQETVVSNQEAIRLRKADVGCRLRLTYTPVRSDLATGEPVSLLSEVVTQGGPLGLELTLPSTPVEDQELDPRAVYFGGEEGPSEWQWYRSKDPPRAEASSRASWTPIAHTRKYTPGLADVGCYLILEWTPVRADGNKGAPLDAFATSPVEPAPPEVLAIEVRESGQGGFVGIAQYHGGLEGASRKQWLREQEKGKLVPIPGATSNMYEPGEEDYSGKLVYSYTPVRTDGTEGTTVFSEPGGTVYPELPGLGRLTISGKVAEGQMLTALEDLPGGDKQQDLWRRFKKEIKYQWSRSAPGSPEHFSPLPAQRSVSYKVRLDDVGRHLKCECTVVDVFGRAAPPVACVTDVVKAAEPKIERLQVDGRGFHTSTYAVRGTYSGGREGKSVIQWFRASGAKPNEDLTPIPGATGPVYEAQLDDVGSRLAARYTPVRDDGAVGEPVIVLTAPIAVDPEVAREVKNILDGGAAKFETGAGAERRVVDVNRKRIKVVRPGLSKASFSTVEVKGTYAPPFKVELFGDDPNRLKIVIDDENDIELVVHTRNTRDVIALAVRGFAQRFH
ncbi:AIR9 protein [Klebsormidium nitens]|uniref:AIR9 protein n=1 Tax=Klebsormidium nitens TaxID=105231 RepID=A0A1Y1HID7_KLENI|nr:AIR9 protein [Klebsormidium nitens]|eukprot:GAQ78250.1 AIR9 protein [Klebsormidium nitens]